MDEHKYSIGLGLLGSPRLASPSLALLAPCISSDSSGAWQRPATKGGQAVVAWSRQGERGHARRGRPCKARFGATAGLAPALPCPCPGPARTCIFFFIQPWTLDLAFYSRHQEIRYQENIAVVECHVQKHNISNQMNPTAPV